MDRLTRDDFVKTKFSRNVGEDVSEGKNRARLHCSKGLHTSLREIISAIFNAVEPILCY